MGLHANLSSACQNLTWLELAQVVCIVSQPLWIPICTTLHIQKTLFPCSTSLFLAFVIFSPLFINNNLWVFGGSSMVYSFYCWAFCGLLFSSPLMLYWQEKCPHMFSTSTAYVFVFILLSLNTFSLQFPVSPLLPKPHPPPLPSTSNSLLCSFPWDKSRPPRDIYQT